MRLFQDPGGKPSMVRTCAFLLTLTTIVAVVLGRDAAVIAALVGVGVVSLLTRTKAQ